MSSIFKSHWRLLAFVVLTLFFSIGLITPAAAQSGTVTPGAQQVTCAGAPPTQLSLGERAAVWPFKTGEPAAPVRVRDRPGYKGLILAQLQSGTQMSIIGGPQCLDGFIWWQIQTDDGFSGWAAEGSTQNYFLDPLNAASIDCPAAPPTRMAVGTVGTVRPAKAGAAVPNSARIRNDYSTKAAVVYNLPENEQFSVNDGPRCVEGYIWWKVTVKGKASGWLAEGDTTRGYYVIPIGYNRPASAAPITPTPEPRAQPKPVIGVAHASLSSDDRTIAASFRDAKTRVWDVESGSRVAILNYYSVAMIFTPDSKALLFGDDQQSVISVEWNTGKVRQTYRASVPLKYVLTLVYSADGSKLAAVDGEGAVVVWDAASGRELSAFMEGERVTIAGAAFSPDGTRLVTAGVKGANEAVVWDWAAKTPVFTLKGHTDVICGLDWSPDGKTIVSASLDTTIRVWDAATGKQIRRFASTRPATAAYTLSYSHDSQRVLVAHNDQITRLWSLEGGEGVQFIGQFCLIDTVGFFADDKRIFTASYDGTVRIWDATTGGQLKVFTAET